MYLSLQVAYGRKTFELRFIDGIKLGKIILQTPLCASSSDILMIVIDLTSEMLLEQAKELAQKFQLRERKKIQHMVFVGLNFDILEEKEAISEMYALIEFCRSEHIPFYHVSTKTGKNIALLTECIKDKAREIMRTRERPKLRREKIIYDLKRRYWMY